MTRKEHRAEYDSLARDIRAKKHLQTVFVPSPGNWGDSLINAGTREFFRHYNIEYLEVKRTDVFEMTQMRTSHFVIGGGGGWCRYWRSTPEYVMSILPNAGYVTVLPTSIADAPKQPKPAANLNIYSRGETNLESTAYDLKICHDMAFHCTDWRLYENSSEATLLAMREDAESRFDSIPEGNFDISLKSNGYADSRPFYHTISLYSTIQTDRLHVGIAAAQLGLDVDLYTGGYSKASGVYDHSMKDVYSSVRLIGNE